MHQPMPNNIISIIFFNCTIAMERNYHCTIAIVRICHCNKLPFNNNYPAIAIPPLLSHQPMHQQMPNIIICRRIFKHAITPLHYRYRIIAAIRSRQIVINCHTTITIQPSPSHHCYRTSKCTNQCQTTQFLNLIF